MEPMLEAPRCKRLKLERETPLANFAFKSNSRRCNKVSGKELMKESATGGGGGATKAKKKSAAEGVAAAIAAANAASTAAAASAVVAASEPAVTAATVAAKVGWCRLTLSNPR